MRQPQTKTRPRKTTLASFPVPTAGLISNRNLALPVQQGQPPGAVMLTNFLPTPQSVVLRRGIARRATLPNFGTVKSVFSYVLGQQQQIFAASDDGIWNVTSIPNPYPQYISPGINEALSTENDEVIGWGSALGFDVLTGTTSGDWVTVQFSTSGGTYLIGVNGVDPAFIYDGAEFWPYVAGGISSIGVVSSADFEIGEIITGTTSGATAEIVRISDTGLFLYVKNVAGGPFDLAETITGSVAGVGVIDVAQGIVAPGASGLPSDRMSYVWAYKQRIWFLERDTLNAWYLPVDQIGGDLTELPLGGVFNRGGSLLWGQTWSLDSGGDGGLSEQNVFVSTEGEVAAYQGLSPDDANSWGKVGVYRVGRPLGKKAFIRAGGDLVIATSIGFIPLGRAIGTDYAGLGLIAVSQPIAEDWRLAVQERGLDGWQCELWGEGSMTLISPPTTGNSAPVLFVANSDSGAWARFTGWQPTAMEVFQGRLYFGSVNGAFQEAWVGGSDEGIPYTGVLMPLFNDLGGPAQRKIAKFARVVRRSSVSAEESVVARWDWDMSVPPAPSADAIPVGNEWDNAIWDESIWDAERGTFVSEAWRSVAGSGYSASLVIQVTSASLVPIDVEIVRIDFSYEQGDIVT